MQVAFSTLGCSELSLAQACGCAVDLGYSGLELRSVPGGTVDVAADVTQRRTWRRELETAGVSALAVATYVRVCDLGVSDEAVLDAGVAQVRLAHDLGAPWVRVFPGGKRGEPTAPEVEARAGRVLAGIVAATAGLGVHVALETHDSHPTARDVLRLLATPDCPPISVIWDALHPWLAGETFEETADLLPGRIAYVQVKDVVSQDDLTPVGLGDGALPLAELMGVWRDRVTSDWVSWEYERQWFPEAPALSEVGAAGRSWLAGWERPS